MSSTSSTIRIVIDGVSEGLRGAATQSAADLLRLKKSADDTDKSVGKLGKTTVKAFASFGAVGNAIPAITGLVTSLATASGALLVLPGAALGAGVALGTLKFATAGFGDAVKAADPKEFAKATENMGKTAVETAKAVRQLKDPLEELRKTSSNQFFTGLTADVKQLGGTYLPILGKQIPLISGDLGRMADASAKALLAPESVRAVNTVLAETRKVTQDLGPALGNVVAGVLQIGAAGAREFGLFGLSVASATQRFREWATAANESGKIADLIVRGREEFAKWGTLLGNVGSIAKTIFTGLSGGQTDFIANMIRATDAVKVFLASAAGQNGLATLGNILATTAAITRDVFLVALQSVLPIIAASGPAIQQFAGIIGGALTAALSIVGPPLQALGKFLGDNVAVVQVLGPLILGLVVAFKGLSILGSLVLPLAVMVIAMNAVGLATGRLTLALRILQLAAGPIGIILAGVTIALGVFAAANLSSGDAVKVNQEAVDSIKGTLDQYTGAVTSATRAQVAGELSTRTLSDGHTTLADAIRASGISLEDYTNAATGNQDALQKVNRALLDQATAFVENDANLGRWKKTVEDAHVPAEVLALAVIGNDDALKSLTTTYGINAGVAEQLVTSLKAQVGTLDEVGSALGAYNAQLSEAQKQATAAADANRAFGQVLGALKDGLAGLVGGGAPLAIMVDGFKSLSASARDSAQETGNAASQLGGVEAGARKAAQSMQESRDSFIQAAIGAGIGEKAANLLADQLGLIPKVADIAFRTNATDAERDLLNLNVQISRVPPGVPVKVEALTDEARKKLEDLGIFVTQLPNGEFEVTANTALAKQNLADVVAEVGRSVGTIMVDANTKPADTKIKGSVTLADGSTGTMTLDANPNPATGKVQGVVKLADGSTGTITVDGNRDPATGKINATITYANGSKGAVQVEANTAAAQAAIDRLKVTTYSTHIVRITSTGDVIGRGVTGLAKGGLLMPMASGGVLTRLSGASATVVQPNTWRVIGDNMRVPEAFIPLDGSARSMRILAEAATRMGRSIVPMAAGGVTVSGGTAVPAAPEIRVFIGNQELTDIVRTEIHTNERDVVRRARVGSGVTF
jgi:hypothetical protein